MVVNKVEKVGRESEQMRKEADDVGQMPRLVPGNSYD
jgi:hypothetical protein